MIVRACSLLALVAALFASAASAQPTSVKRTSSTAPVTGTFTNLRYHQEAGDLVGTEIFIFFAGDSGYFALVQCSPGYPGAPVLVPVNVMGTRVSFNLPVVSGSHCPTASFVGKISQKELRGEFNNDGEAYVLPRRASYWNSRK